MKLNGSPVVNLPSINYFVHKIKFSMEEREAYEKIEKEALEKLKKHKESASILEVILKLRQICDDKQIANLSLNISEEGDENDEDKEQEKEQQEEKNKEEKFQTSSKTKALLELLKSNSDKALVFSQWVTYLDLIELSLKDADIQFVRLDGRMLRYQREKAINDFNNNPKIKVFLISLKCGSMGLNLTIANQCFLMDPWWNPGIENQAID